MKRPTAALRHDDGRHRCPWAGLDQIYVTYHDEEWGVPEYNDRALFEKLILDGFQAGLSWITILRKRENFRRAFSDFEPEKIARYTPKKIERLMQDAGIVRNRAKIEGTVASARIWLKIMESGPGFSQLLWDQVGGRPQQHKFKSTKEIPAATELSLGCRGKEYSNELYAKGDRKLKPEFLSLVGAAAAVIFTLPKDDTMTGTSRCLKRMGVLRGNKITLRYKRLDMVCDRTRTEASIAVRRGLDQ
jgi:DNA-3-methyladenine glycosylase I